jgi:tetratricopeptide (TPR) repeat protein
VLAAPVVLYAACVCGCVWSGGPASFVPREISLCRELTERGALAMQQGELGTAEAQFRNALEANPADVNARRLFAEALWSRGDMPAAIAQMEGASQLAPHDTALKVRVGEMLLAAGEVPRALARAESAIADNPRYGPAWALSGRVHWAARDHKRAIANLQRSLVYAPSDKRTLLSLAQLYLERGEARRALTTVHQLIDLCPPGTESPDALLLEGQAYLAAGRPADAAESLFAASQCGQPNAEVYYLLAVAEAERGRTEAAVRAAHQALAANAAHPRSLELLAQLKESGVGQGATLRR